MKRNILFVFLLMSLCCTAFSEQLKEPVCAVATLKMTSEELDAVSECNARRQAFFQSKIMVDQHLGASNVTPTAVGAISSQKTYILPKLDEFYVPLQTMSTVIGALFGSLKRQNKEIVQYWEMRKGQLDSENAECLTLTGDDNIKQCLQNVRQIEIRKTENIKSLNAQRVAQQYAQSAYYQSAFQQIGNQMRYSAPVTTNCNTYGSYGYRTTNCSSY